MGAAEAEFLFESSFLFEADMDFGGGLSCTLSHGLKTECPLHGVKTEYPLHGVKTECPSGCSQAGVVLSNTGSILCAKGDLNVAREEDTGAQNMGFVLIMFPSCPEQGGEPAFLLDSAVGCPAALAAFS